MNAQQNARFGNLFVKYLPSALPENLAFFFNFLRFFVDILRRISFNVFTNKNNWFDPLKWAKALPGGIQKQRGCRPNARPP
jgi:hypothetical protein